MTPKLRGFFFFFFQIDVIIEDGNQQAKFLLQSSTKS